MSKCFLRFIQEFSILGLNHPWLTLCSYRALYRVIYIVFILLTFLCTQRIKSDLRGPREIWTALILWKVNLRAAKSWFDSPSSEKVKVSPSNFLAAVFFSKMFFSLSAWKIMIGQSKEGLFVVYDCMANASLPWINACSHLQCLASLDK